MRLVLMTLPSNLQIRKLMHIEVIAFLNGFIDKLLAICYIILHLSYCLHLHRTVTHTLCEKMSMVFD